MGPLQCTVRECCRDAHRELARGELQKRETLQCLGEEPRRVRRRVDVPAFRGVQ